MADTQAKRFREEEEEDDIVGVKHYKSCNYNNNNNQEIFLSFLENDEVEEQGVVSTKELSVFLKTLQQELLSDPLTLQSDPAQQTPNDSSPISSEEDEKEKVIRHLLEASDDELGIPNKVDDDRTVNSGDEDFNGLDDDYDNRHNPFLFCDGLWELEDEAANYYTLLQSQLFL